MLPITVITTNRSNKIDATIESALSIEPKQILIGSYVPFETTNRKIDVVKLQGDDQGKELNELMKSAKNDWILYLREEDVILSVNDDFDFSENEIYACLILQNDVIIKEARIWNKKNKVSFKNPVCEKLSLDATKVLDIIIYENKKALDAKKIDLWKRSNPLAIDPYYYKAFIALSERKFKEFKSMITHYLFNAKKMDISHIMSRYYLAFVQGMIEDAADDAIKNLVLCLSENLLMAEFWCLLGDIFTKLNKFSEAIDFYQNAIILGSRRLKLDLWPMQISKYHEYPTEMISQCNKVLKNSRSLS